MNILKANLRLYYQHRRLWLWYAILVVLFFLSFASFQNFFLLALFVGALAADTQRDVLTKPFSFTLPGHHEARRRLLFRLGSALSFLMAAGFVALHRFPFPVLVLFFLAMASVAITFYFGGVFLGLSRFASAIGIIWMVFITTMIQPEYAGLIETIVMRFPLWIILAGGLFSRYSWKRLGDRSLERRLCGSFMIGIGDSFDYQARLIRQMQRQQCWDRKQFRPIESIEDLFVSRIKASAPCGKARYLIGSFYAKFSMSFTPLGMVIYPLLLVGASIFFGYTGANEMQPYFIFFPMLVVMGTAGASLLPHPTLLLPGGRVEKFHFVAITGLFMMLVIFLTILLIVELTIPLSSIMPSIVVKGRPYPFHAISMQHVHLLFAVQPIGMLLGTLFARKHVTWLVGLVLIAAVSLAIPLWEFLAPVIIPATISGKITLVTTSWASCLFALHYHFRKRNLV